MLPVAIMVEKLCRVHRKEGGAGYALRVAARVPLALFVWLLALMLPFFGVINDLLGAFCVSFETYIIPCAAYTIYYAGSGAAKRARRANAVVQPPRWFPWPAVFALNALIIGGALIVGLGFGGYASVTALIESVDKFGLFSRCYNC
jgi:auxin influx carrier (AUX1 LAX family)